MTKGWKVEKLGDIGKVSMCKRIFKDQTTPTGDIPFYKIGTFGKEPDAYISKEIYDEFRNKFSFPKKGDILISASGTIGRRVKYDGKPAYFQDSNIVWIDNDETQVLNDYLYYFYEACNWNSTKGATISRLYTTNLQQLEIAFPKSLSEQQRIVALLDETFAGLAQVHANAERNLVNAREVFEVTSNIIISESNADWEETKLGDVCDFTRGPFGGSLKKNIFKKTGYAVYEQRHAIHKDYSEIRYFIDEAKFKEMERFELRSGDLIMSCSGVTLGRVSIAPENLKPGIINQALLKLTPIDNKISPEFLKRWMESESFQASIKAYSGGAAIPNVASVKILKEIPIYLPPLEEQRAIVGRLDGLAAETSRLEAVYQSKLEAVEELRKSVLGKAFAGGL